MNKNDKINTVQLCSLMFGMSITTFLGIGIFSIIKASKIDSYLGVIIGSIAGILVFLLFLYIANYKPNLNIFEKNKLLFGIIIGDILNFILCISAFILGTTVFYNLINFIISQFLSETPFLIIGLVFAFIIIFINIKGIEDMSRVSLILISINIILFIIFVLGITPTIRLDNLKPLLEGGIQYPLKGAVYMISLNIIPILLLLVIPKNKISDKKNYNKFLSFTYLIICIIMIATIIIVIGSLGIYLASYYQFPEYMVLKRINLFNFIDRIENLIILQWIFGAFINISFVVYFISSWLTSKEKKKNIFSIIITIILLITALTFFRNNTFYNDFNYKYAIYPRLLSLIIYIIITITIFIKKRIKNN